MTADLGGHRPSHVTPRLSYTTTPEEPWVNPISRWIRNGNCPRLIPIFRRLKAEIRRWGRVLVPIVVDEHDRIIDGKLRWEIAQELGIRDIPRVIVRGLTDDEQHDLRLIINICRRHLSREQVRQWIAWELQIHPDHSDRMVAGKIGVSPTTVGKVRATAQVGQSHSRLGADGKYRRAVVYTQTERQRKQAQEILQSLNETPQDANLNLRKLRHLRWAQERAEKLASARHVSLKDFDIINCDFRDVGERIKSHSVDVAIVDPPWSEWESLGRPLGRELCRILRPNGVACVYTGSFYEDQWNDRLQERRLSEGMASDRFPQRSWWHALVQGSNSPVMPAHSALPKPANGSTRHGKDSA